MWSYLEAITMRRVGFIAFPHLQVLSLSTLSVFECANMLAKAPLYALRILSESGGPVRTSSVLSLETESFDDTKFDTLIVLGTLVDKPIFSPGLVDYVRSAPRRVRRVASLCTGALVFVEAGLLDGRRVTTQKAYAPYFRERFPKVKLDDDPIFLVDCPFWASAGCTACDDLCLAMVESDGGKDLARAVAKDLVLYHRRAGGQAQYSALLELAPKSDRIQSALDYTRCNLQAPLTIAQLAKAEHLSPRQFSRAFHQETGQSPAPPSAILTAVRGWSRKVTTRLQSPLQHTSARIASCLRKRRALNCHIECVLLPAAERLREVPQRNCFGCSRDK
jgi:transcriptional regulator GlxA family with amidase domain